MYVHWIREAKSEALQVSRERKPTVSVLSLMSLLLSRTITTRKIRSQAYNTKWVCIMYLGHTGAPQFSWSVSGSSLSSLSLKELSCKMQPMNHCKSQISESPTIITVSSSNICKHKFLLDLVLGSQHQSNHRMQRKISPSRCGVRGMYWKPSPRKQTIKIWVLKGLIDLLKGANFRQQELFSLASPCFPDLSSGGYSLHMALCEACW